MLNRFIKKSVASKLFLMNLLILVIIVVSQLLFQAIYFESYYLDKKKELLEKKITDFEKLLNTEPNKREIIEFIEHTMRKDNVALSFRDIYLSNRIGLESYMGSRQIRIKGNDNNKYNIIMGDQFINVEVKSNDFIKVVGTIDEYGYVIAQRIFINDVEVGTYYDIIPNNLDRDATMATPLYPSLEVGKEIIFNGYIEEFINKNNNYFALSNADIYLTREEKLMIFNSESYNGKINNNNSTEDIMFSSIKVSDGYIVAVTTLAEVNEVIGTMNSYYFIIFIVAFLLVVIISLIYSKFMTKPLVEMSNVAKRIAECDFQYKYNVKSEDEIGVLGESLNLISSNLEKSLSELQDANEKLKNEMDIKKVQEEKRKDLIANISHELKTPITIIQGSINGIKSGMYDVDMYEDILEETNKMNELVREMLEISKLESPSFNLKKEPFDLGSVFLKEKDKLKGLIKEKSLEINYNDFDDVIVFGDEKRINQVVTNLLTNAIKYTPDGEKINISIELIEDKNQYVFSIENFGVTLSKVELDKIWDAFYRKEKSRNKKFGGTGLGLSIVKRILELHNSEYGVSSENNSVKFYFAIKKCMGY